MWVPGFENKSVFDMLTDFMIFAASLFYLAIVSAVFVLRRRHPDWNRPYRTWGYPWLPLLFCACYALFLGQVYRGKPLEANAGLALIGLGIPVFYAWRSHGVRAVSPGDVAEVTAELSAEDQP